MVHTIDELDIPDAALELIRPPMKCDGKA